MYEKTSSIKFKKYGEVFEGKKELYIDECISSKVVTSNKIVRNMYNYSDTVHIEIVEGMAYILVTESMSIEPQLFAIHRNIRIKPKMYFNIIPMENEVSYNIILPFNYRFKMETLDKSYIYDRILPTINIPEIMAYYYSIKDPNYKFQGESHNLYELTFVDNGILNTTIDEKEYTLNSYDLVIYGKNQYHNQKVGGETSCSYLTVMFDMECRDDSLICNRVFHCRKELYKIIKTFARNISSTLPYANNLILNNFHEIIIRLFQYDYLGADMAKLPTETQQNFEDELLKEIVEYIEKMICEPITIEELCDKFSISRSSLQILFKNNVNISPKKYITDLKLARSKLLIKEGKYTISEIALMLGFSSIHYFSRTFTQYYEISPSEYSQKAFK